VVSPTIKLPTVVGAIVMLMREAAETVTLSWPLTVPSVALSVALPAAIPVPRPTLAEALEIARTLALLDDQVTEAVRSEVVPSVYVPVAV
jgi:hypothetical protein